MPAYKQLRASPDLFHAFDACLALIAIGARHSKLSAEVRKTLAQRPPMTESQRGTWFGIVLSELIPATLELHADEQREAWITMGRAQILQLKRNEPKGSTYAYERPEDIPEDIALGIHFWNTDSWFDAGPLTRVCACVPWVGKAKVEEIYLPRGFVRAYRAPFDPEDAVAMLRARRDVLAAKPTPPPAVSRNGPCPCGSGKKHKRCCADRDASM